MKPFDYAKYGLPESPIQGSQYVRGYTADGTPIRVMPAAQRKIVPVEIRSRYEPPPRRPLPGGGDDNYALRRADQA